MMSLKTAAVSAAALIATALAIPHAVAAQPSPAAPPSYAAKNPDQRIDGTVVGFDGKYALKVRDRRGWIDNVTLHQGTIINPTGLPLRTGMPVTVYGYNAGAAFAANEIDAPVPPVVVAPYPPVSLGIGFGFGWHRW